MCGWECLILISSSRSLPVCSWDNRFRVFHSHCSWHNYWKSKQQTVFCGHSGDHAHEDNVLSVGRTVRWIGIWMTQRPGSLNSKLLGKRNCITHTTKILSVYLSPISSSSKYSTCIYLSMLVSSVCLDVQVVARAILFELHSQSLGSRDTIPLFLWQCLFPLC